MNVKQIKIDFRVTKEIKRFVYVYLIETETGCALVDSGVAGSETVIEKVISESGHDPNEIKAIFLTHAHPDHIGTAGYFRETYGVRIYASEGEQPWIENIDLQFKERPIPNFYHLSGKSVMVDQVVKDGDQICLSEGIFVEAIATPGHSVDGMSYRVGDAVFIGDTVPVRGDIPIFIDPDATRSSLATLEKLSDVDRFYPAWDQTYSPEMMRQKLSDAREIVDELEQIICDAGPGMELTALVDLVCEKWQMPMWKNNPLFTKTIACCRRQEK